MKINNETSYDTKVIRSLVAAVHSWMAKDIKLGRKKIGRLQKRVWDPLQVNVTDKANVSTCTASVIVPTVFVRAKGVQFTLPVRKARTLEAALKSVKQGRGDLSSLLNTQSEIRSVARVIWHNLLHLYGYEHHQFPKEMPHTFDWAVKEFGEKLPLKQPKPKVPKTKEEKQRARYERVLELEKEWLRKFKLAQTKIKKLRVKKRYYEKELTRNGTQGETRDDDA